MSDLPLSCDFPKTELEQQLDIRRFRTFGARLASPPARKVDGISDSSEDMDHAVAYADERFMDVRPAFLTLRRGLLPLINLFMIFVLFVMWMVGQFYYGVFMATVALVVPLWVAFFVYEIFFPLTLPIRIDRKEAFVYVGYRGTFYRIPWEKLEVTFSYSLQYFGSCVMWDRQYYSHLYLRSDFYFCGKKPKRKLQRLRFSSYFKEDHLYRKWNFIVRYFDEGLVREDRENLVAANYDSYVKSMRNKSLFMFVVDYVSVLFLVPTIIWGKFSPFKFKWPEKIEAVFGKNNYY
ncbi:hypothetical protein [Marinobacter mangrovi]|uniref:hypothetical protein n=1 Tax=Marinobacter mangrovi TaxID=2803918 RepID=UPI00193416EC|nr:hypothetical protein [Marinobacter mangrovi]